MRRIRQQWASGLLILVACTALLLSGGGAIAGTPGVTGSPDPTVNTATPVRPQVWVLRVYYRSQAERDLLAAELGAEEMETSGSYLTVMADAGLYSYIQTLGLRVEVDAKETAVLNDAHLFGGGTDTFYSGYKTVEEMQSFLDQYVAAYPTLAQKVDFGNSWCKDHPGCTRPNTYSGYDLWALHITNQAIAGPKPVFWYEAGIHAREIATPEIAMRYIQWLLDNYNSDPDAHWLVDYHDIWVVPMLNPDGHHIVEAGGGGSSPYYQRKNSDNKNGCTVWPPTVSNQFGTDNNRNFPFKWKCCGGSSGSACTQTYRGPTASSDSETTYAVTKIRTLIPDQRGTSDTSAAPITATGVFQDMHANAALNLYPWGWTTTAAPNGTEFAVLGAHIKATNASPAGNNYQSCAPPVCLYGVDGDSVDWAYGELGAAAFTTEVGGSDFLVPLSYVTGTLWPANKGPLIYEAKIARTPYLLAHGPDTRAVATSPMTVTQGTTAQLTATINFAWTGNTLAQNVGAAEYYIDTPPWAAGTASVMSGSFGGAQTVNASATVATSGLSVGRHILFVRGRGVNNVSGLQTWGPVTAAWLWVNP